MVLGKSRATLRLASGNARPAGTTNTRKHEATRIILFKEKKIFTLQSAGWSAAQHSVVEAMAANGHVGKEPMGRAFSADGKRALAVNDGDGTVSLIDLESAKTVGRFQAGTGSTR